MARSVQEIATDIKEAVRIIGETSASLAGTMSGPPSAEGTPKVEVRLDDGRTVELSALADEILVACDKN